MSGPTQTPVSTPATLQVKVAAKRTEAQDICSLELVAADDSALPAFTAGAHIDVHLPNGLVRQYSLSNAPSETNRYVIGVLRDAASRGGSAAVHEQLHEGTQLQISAPRNHFALAHDGGDHFRQRQPVAQPKGVRRHQGLLNSHVLLA